MTKTTGLLERLKRGERILVAEGYLFEVERRGYAKMGSMVPEVLIERPEKVKELHEEFVRSGTDVVESYNYHALRWKLKDIGRDESEFEPMNRTAFKMARDVADDSGCLMAGSVNNTNIVDPADASSYAKAEAIFEEQVRWAVEEGADFIIAETFHQYKEASLALNVIKSYGIPAVVTFAVVDKEGKMLLDGVPVSEGMRRLEEEGAAVVGCNCVRGPTTILPILREARKVCKGPLAALPVCFRCTEEAPTMHRLKGPDGQKYPEDIRAFSCSPVNMEAFAKGCEEIGIQYVGLCCGNDPHLFRALAVSFGRNPPAAKYMPDYKEKSCIEGRNTRAPNKFITKLNEFAKS